VGVCCRLRAAVFVFWPVVVTGRSWVVVGVGRCVVVAVGGVVGLCSWLVEGRSDVTGCDISVMFKLAREITCTISHDFLAVYSKNPSVLVHSWSNLGRGEIQPSGLVSVLLSSGEAHLPTFTSENHPSLAELGRARQELQGDNKDLENWSKDRKKTTDHGFLWSSLVFLASGKRQTGYGYG